MIRGERLIKLGDGWFSTKAIEVAQFWRIFNAIPLSFALVYADVVRVVFRGRALSYTEGVKDPYRS